MTFAVNLTNFIESFIEVIKVQHLCYHICAVHRQVARLQSTKQKEKAATLFAVQVIQTGVN